MTSRSGKVPVSRTLRSSQQEVQYSASTIRYPSIPPGQDYLIPSVEEEEDIQEEQGPGQEEIVDQMAIDFAK